MLALDSPVKVDVTRCKGKFRLRQPRRQRSAPRLMSCSAKPQPSDQGTARTKKIIKCDNALAAAVQCWTPRDQAGRNHPAGGVQDCTTSGAWHGGGVAKRHLCYQVARRRHWS